MKISMKDFQKVEMKVGKVIDVQDIEGSRNLIKLIVDFGAERKQAIAGLRNIYGREDLLNKKFVFVTNLEEKEFMGEVSECMILAAEDEKGNVILIKPEKDIEVGSKIL